MSFIPQSTSPTSDMKQVSSSPSTMTAPLPSTDVFDAFDASPESTVKPSSPHVTTSVPSSPSSTSPASPPIVVSPVSTLSISHVQVSDMKERTNPRGRRQDSSGTSSSSGTTATSTSGRTHTSEKGSTFSVSTISDGIRNILHEIGDILAKLMKSSATQAGQGATIARPTLRSRSKSLSMSFKRFLPASSNKAMQESAPTANPATPVRS